MKCVINSFRQVSYFGGNLQWMYNMYY